LVLAAFICYLFVVVLRLDLWEGTTPIYAYLRLPS